MSITSTPAWARKTYVLYLVSLIAWAVGITVATIPAVIMMVTYPSDEGFDVSPFFEVILMLCAFPGLLYFFVQSRKFRRFDPETADSTMNNIMTWQNITGVVAIAGAVIGFIPFSVNALGFLSLGLVNGDSIDGGSIAIGPNLVMIVPWVSLYGFVATYICAMVFNRQRKSATQATT